MDHIEINITNMQLHTEESWVYFILDEEHKKIVHLGSTWLHPIARVEKHISDKVLAKYEHNEHLVLLAFPLGNDIDRKLLKRLLISSLEIDILGETVKIDNTESAVSKEMEFCLNNILGVLTKKLRLTT